MPSGESPGPRTASSIVSIFVPRLSWGLTAKTPLWADDVRQAYRSANTNNVQYFFISSKSVFTDDEAGQK